MVYQTLHKKYNIVRVHALPAAHQRVTMEESKPGTGRT